MAKTGLLGGNGQTPPIFANTSPVFSNPGSVFRRGEGGILPERGSRAQYDMVQALLQSGVASSRNSGSPLLAFLAPMVGGALGARTEGLYRGAQEGRDKDAIDQLLAAMGGGVAPAGMSTRRAPTVSMPGVTPEIAPSTARNAAMAAHGGPTNAAAEAMAIQEKPANATGASIKGLFVTPETRATYRPSANALNISMDFNAAPSGNARGTEVIIPDNAPPEVRASAERFNALVADFARQNGIADYPIRGVRTTSENGRGVSNTVHVEPFFNSDMQMQQAIKANPGAFAAIYQEAFGGLDGARLIAPHGVGKDRGAGSSVFGDETSYGQMIANTILSNPTAAQAGPTAQVSPTAAQANAARLASGDFSTLATSGQPAPMSRDNMRTLIGLMTNPDVSEPIRDLASSMMTDAMGGRNGLSPSDQIKLARDMLGLEAALAPAPPEPRFRVATPEEAAAYGAEAGQIGPDGRFYPSPAGNTSGDAGVLRQRNEATTIIGEAVADLQAQGYSREEALGMVARDPIYGSQFQILGVDPADIARAQVAATAEAAQNNVSVWDRIFGRDATPAPASDNDPLGIR